MRFSTGTEATHLDLDFSNIDTTPDNTEAEHYSNNPRHKNAVITLNQMQQPTLTDT